MKDINQRAGKERRGEERRGEERREDERGQRRRERRGEERAEDEGERIGEGMGGKERGENRIREEEMRRRDERRGEEKQEERRGVERGREERKAVERRGVEREDFGWSQEESSWAQLTENDNDLRNLLFAPQQWGAQSPGKLCSSASSAHLLIDIAKYFKSNWNAAKGGKA